MLKEGRPIGAIAMARRKRAAVSERQIDLAPDLRRPGRDRNRECAALRGGAGAHERAAGIARISDCDKRRAKRHQPVAFGASACFRRDRARRPRSCAPPNTRSSPGPLTEVPSCCGKQRRAHAYPVHLGHPGCDQSRLGSLGRVALERRTIHVPDVLADPEFKRPDWQEVGKQRSVLGVPLVREGALLGVLIAARGRRSGPLPRSRSSSLTTFADQAVIAINNVGLFDEVQARTKRARPLGRASCRRLARSVTRSIRRLISRQCCRLSSQKQCSSPRLMPARSTYSVICAKNSDCARRTA